MTETKDYIKRLHATLGNGHSYKIQILEGCPRGVVVKAMEFGIVVSEFELQSRFYVHFRANTLGKGMNTPYPPSYGLNSTATVLLGE